jgi:hypothetical protein
MSEKNASRSGPRTQGKDRFLALQQTFLPFTDYQLPLRREETPLLPSPASQPKPSFPSLTTSSLYAEKRHPSFLLVHYNKPTPSTQRRDTVEKILPL